MWIEVSSSVPHFLQLGSFPILIMHRRLLKVLCPVSRPITTLAWVLLRDNSRTPVAGSGTEINSRACLCVLQVPCHNARCCFPIQRFNFLLIICLESPKKGSGPTNRWAQSPPSSLSAISSLFTYKVKIYSVNNWHYIQCVPWAWWTHATFWMSRRSVVSDKWRPSVLKVVTYFWQQTSHPTKTIFSQRRCVTSNKIQGESLARGPKLLSMYTVE